MAKAMQLQAVVVLLLASFELGAYSDVRFEHLSLEHGLAQSAVQDMVGDELGYMWFGTQYGLSRYDGYEFRNFRHQPNDPGSLSNSRIKSLLRGHDGTIWIGTRSGLNRLDPRTLDIERVVLTADDGRPVEGGQPEIQHMAEDGAGNLLVQAKRGVAYFDRDSGQFRSVSFEYPVPPDAVGVPVADQRGRVWLFNSHGLWRFDPERSLLVRVLIHEIDGRAVRQHSITAMPSGQLALAGQHGVLLFDPAPNASMQRIRPTAFGHESDRVPALAADPDGNLWLLTREHLVQYDVEADEWHRRLRRWRPDEAESHLDYEIELSQDSQGYTWIGLPEGVALFSPASEDIQLLRHDPTRPSSLKASPWSALYRIHVDDFGAVWIGGGLGGLSRFSPQSARFEHVIDPTGSEPFGVDNVVRAVLETERDGKQLLWTGLTFSGIRIWERNDNTYSLKVAELNTLAPEHRRLPDNAVWALEVHPETGDVWVGTSRGLAVVDGDALEVSALHPLDDAGEQVRIKAMAFSPDGRELWAAGSRKLMHFQVDAETASVRLSNSRPVAPPGKHDLEYSIFDMIRLESGLLMVGTRRGINLWDTDDDSLTRVHPAGQSGEHPRNFIFGMAETDKGRIWLGSEQGGLARAELRGRRLADVRWYDRDSGLPDDTVYAILPAESGRLWLSSNRGLIRFNPETGRSRHFTLGDGLQALEFNNTVATKGESGLFYFGGINGVNVFRPQAIELHPEPPRVFLQRVEINDQPVALDATRPLTVNTTHNRNFLLIDFVGLHFVEPERNRYAYQLVGADQEWVYSGSLRTVRYPELPPGEYRFRVRAANSDGVWSQARELLTIRVASPPWLSAWAFSLYVAVLALAIIAFVLIERGRRRKLESVVAERTRELRERNELVDSQARELEEVLDTRTILFANISHEFRTPLTLIEAGLDRLVRNPQDAGAVMTARRYLRRLLRLADQLLNLSRLQSARNRPEPEPWSIDHVVGMTVEAFNSLAEQKGIRLVCEIEGRWLTQCHQADVERILLNLIGNSLKYCPPESQVTVSLQAAEDGVMLSVCDDGPGIDPDQQDLIFERFNRLPAHEHGRIEGAGIGLTLVREATRANGGCVAVDSEPGEGACFRVTLPAWRGHMEGAPVDRLIERRVQLELENLTAESEAGSEDQALAPAPSTPHERLGTALVAEDNSDLRQHLVAGLSGDWEVLEAEDGQKALELARERMPDVVVSDIMMPRLDGLELLKRLRDDVRTSHLPILLLTARQDEATRLQGYSLSADDFLAKPFSPGELRVRLRRMIDIRRRLQARLWREFDARSPGRFSPPPADQGMPDLSERDERLLERVRSWLEANLDDPEAGMEALAEFVAVDSRTLQRKLKAITGQTPAAHLQAARMERARQLLATTDRSIQDIALSCGYSSPQYFSRVFAKAEGISPSQWRQRERRSS